MQRKPFRNKRKSSSGPGANNSSQGSSNGNRSRKPPGRGGSRGGGGGKKKSTLDPNLLVRKATEVEIKEYKSERVFDDLPLNSKLKACIKEKGFERPTEIQDKTLESLLEGRDILGLAQTGTGKTGAFLFPIIEKLLTHRNKSYALVVLPTRELANQVQDEFESLTKGLGFSSACYIGGTNINRDLQKARRPVNLIVATPGRLLDLVDRRLIDLRRFHTLVLDEFDRMLDMGFVNDVKRIISGMEKREHTMLFSATMDKSQEKLIGSILHNPVTVKVSQGDSTGDHIDQDIIRLDDDRDKFDYLAKMLDDPEFQKVLVFEETKHRVSRLCTKLIKSGIKSDQIHGNKSQNARQRALNAFKRGEIRVLVATDVAARGIDVSDVTHVINYQLPQTFDSYIHRIGRTGRAGKRGKAFTFVN